MHKKLIFLHLGKCGGSTVMANLARSDRVQLFSYNRSSLSLTDEEVLEGSLDADIIHIHGVQGFRSRFSDEQWRRLLDQSIRLCFVREPIQKYISDYRFAFQEELQHQLPFIPNFNFCKIKDVARNRSKIDISYEAFSGGYFTQTKEAMLPLGKCIELSWELDSLSKDNDPSPMISHAKFIYKQTIANLNTNNFAVKSFSEPYDDLLLNYFLRHNSIYNEVGLNLGSLTGHLCAFTPHNLSFPLL